MNKIIVIDRDGVINKDPAGWTKHNYVTCPEDFHFLPGAKEAIKRLSENGFDIIIVSNQAGISKGYYSEKELESVTRKMLEGLEASGGIIKKVYYCLHQDKDSCDCRKPKTGMLDRAEKELGINVKGSFFIGDGKVDIEAGQKKGLKTVLVLSGKTDLARIAEWPVKPDYIFDDLKEAVEFITGGGK